jgi:hypothetical protein
MTRDRTVSYVAVLAQSDRDHCARWKLVPWAEALVPPQKVFQSEYFSQAISRQRAAALKPAPRFITFA